MDIAQYLDSTYLKTPTQSGLSEEETQKIVLQLTNEAMAHDIFAVMIRPNYVKVLRNYISAKKSNLQLGTVIGFHEGNYSSEEKMKEAQQAITDGADELDFVINFEAYLHHGVESVKEEVIGCTQLGLQHGKIVKWIIEIAALSEVQIAELTKAIAQWVEDSFPGKEHRVFVKSSTGFYKTENGKPNGATFEGIEIMLNNAGTLPVTAAGGVRTPEDAEKMIALGVKRIGTSSALALLKNQSSEEGY